MSRIDTHHHAIPADYRAAPPQGPASTRLAGASCPTGVRGIPGRDGRPGSQHRDPVGVDAGTTFLPAAADAAALARDVNDQLAGVVSENPDRFGLFATVPFSARRPRGG